MDTTLGKTNSLQTVDDLFDNRSVFITGGSGFIGRVLIEKLLRSYQGLKNMYLLLRTKKNVAPEARLHKDILSAPIFDKIKSFPNAELIFSKIKIVSGDIGSSNLGISDEDMNKMIEDKSLSIVFHAAATIKFDEPLYVSIKMNLIATKAVLKLCEQLDNLVAFCHVSTAYVNSDIKDNSQIYEKLYTIKQKPEDIIKLVDILDEQQMQALQPLFVDQRPNTYTYTKALAEHLLSDPKYSHLPICIVRPSIVTASWKEPVKGWIDNINGPSGLILAIGKGLLRTMHVKREVVADMIPVDVVVNTMIATTFYTAVKYKKTISCNEVVKNTMPQQQNHNEHSPCEDNNEKTPIIVHCTSGDSNPLKWGDAEDAFFPTIRAYPSAEVLRYPFGSFKGSKYYDLFMRFIVHYLPAICLDFLSLLLGRKRQLMKIYSRLHAALKALEHFCTQNYNYKSNNIKLISNALSNYDKQDLYLTIEGMSWLAYWRDYVLGARLYILKEPTETLQEARRSFKRAYYVEIAFRAVLVVACLLIIRKVLL